MIESGFGWIKINSEMYDYDIVIHVNGSISRRNKKQSKKQKKIYGHTPLSSAELEFLKDEKPDVVYIGTGHNGALPVTPGAEKILEDYEAVIENTTDVISKIETEKRKYSALIHITC